MQYTPPPSPMPLTRDEILSRIRRPLAKRIEHSDYFGGDLVIREMTRAGVLAMFEYARADESAVLNRQYAAIFAASVMDPESKTPMFTPDDILPLSADDAPHKAWDEVFRIGNIAFELSEVSSDSLKSSDPAPDA